MYKGRITLGENQKNMKYFIFTETEHEFFKLNFYNTVQFSIHNHNMFVIFSKSVI